MRHSRIIASLTCLLFLCLAGTALAVADYDHVSPGRGTDQDIESAVKNCLADKDPHQAKFVDVYSFKGHVFMVGEPALPFGVWAERAAHYVQDTHFVSAHWFPPQTSNPNTDPALKSAVVSRLNPVMRSPNRIEVEARGGNVVVLGTVQTPEEVAQVDKLVKGVPGMKAYRSYVMTMEEALKAIGNPSTLYQK